MKKIAVLVSGGGSNLQSIIDACEDSRIKDAKIECVISNKADAFGLQRAKKHGIEALFLNPSGISREEYTNNIIDALKHRNIDLVCFAGFMLILDKVMFEVFEGKVLNIHPALLPKYGGVGMYGMHVHNAVFAAKENKSGVTVHIATADCDEGPIVLQESVDITDCESAEEIAEKVLKIEHKIYPEAIRLIFRM